MHGGAELPAAQGLRVTELRRGGDPRLSAESTNYRDWWKAFNDPVLDRLIARAYRDNLTLQQAGVRVLQARAQLGIAVGEIFPQSQQAVGSVQYNRTSDRASTAAFFGTGGGSFAYWQSTIGAQASWELDFWGRIRRGIQSADASLLATLADYDNTLVTLTADVANTYIALRTAEERIRIAQENIDIQQQTLQIVEARFTYGTVTQLDVEQARTVLLNTQATLPTLETQRRQARDALSVQLGMPPNDLGDLLDGPSAIPVSPPRSSWASRPICCAAGRTSGAPSCRRSRSRPRSEWPRPISSPPSP
jgi:outer membrane protein TolC